MNKESLSAAIKSVLSSFSDLIPKKVDIDLMVVDCIREFEKLDLPYYTIQKNKFNDNSIHIAAPFLESSEIKIEQYEYGSRYKAAILYVNEKPVRKIKLQSYRPEYMREVTGALLDYLKRYLLLKNKFKS